MDCGLRTLSANLPRDSGMRKGTRGSRTNQAPGDECQELNARHVMCGKWWRGPVGSQTNCQIHWWKKVITADAQHGLQDNQKWPAKAKCEPTWWVTDDGVGDAGSAQDHGVESSQDTAVRGFHECAQHCSSPTKVALDTRNDDAGNERSIMSAASRGVGH